MYPPPENPPMAGPAARSRGSAICRRTGPSCQRTPPWGLRLAGCSRTGFEWWRSGPAEPRLFGWTRPCHWRPAGRHWGWLETSIRSYAKFVDGAAKVSGADDGVRFIVSPRPSSSLVSLGRWSREPSIRSVQQSWQLSPVILLEAFSHPGGDAIHTPHCCQSARSGW
jgi:hypothetical protein